MTFKAPYSGIERLLHNLAFSHQLGLQKMLAAIEDDLFAKSFQDIEPRCPVFVTSLPRAGTTLLLEVLAAHPVFVTHTYRDMPFVLSPMLWNRLSRGFRRSGGDRPRVHGDGMSVSFSTPEAFEEAAWRAFWPDKYREDRIEPWTGEEDLGEFGEFFVNHMRKMVALRRAAGAARAERYLSKNNANISRTRMLIRLFPNARIVVPVRHPMRHVRSLLRQHGNFLKLHAEDRFGRRYMESIGHFEFGEALKPIDMGGWLGEAGNLSPLDTDYWLTYWIHTFETLLAQQSEQLVFLSYERLCTEPRDSLHKLAAVLGIDDPMPLLAQTERFRLPERYEPETPEGDSALRNRALSVHNAAILAAIV